MAKKSRNCAAGVKSAVGRRHRMSSVAMILTAWGIGFHGKRCRLVHSLNPIVFAIVT